MSVDDNQLTGAQIDEIYNDERYFRCTLEGDSVRLFLSLYLLGKYSNAYKFYKNYLSEFSDASGIFSFHDAARYLLKTVAKDPSRFLFVLEKRSKDRSDKFVCVCKYRQ